MSRRKLPRLEPGQKPERKTAEVELPDLGVSVLLERPTAGAVIEVQKGLAAADADEFAHLVGLTALCLAEPVMDAAALKTAVEEWSPEDWTLLQAAALDLCGIGGGALKAAQAMFRKVD